MIMQECLDELAEVAGLRDHIAAITERAMLGEIEFESALRERVALLAGLRLEDIDRIVAERITLTAGARALVATMRAHGAYTAMVSGGFTAFTDPISARLGFDEARSNRLEIRQGALTGAILPPVLGREAKRDALLELRSARKLDAATTLAIGDGANDLDMLSSGGAGRRFPRQTEGCERRPCAYRSRRSHCAALCAGLSTRGVQGVSLTFTPKAARRNAYRPGRSRSPARRSSCRRLSAP